ncbi:SDR family NAD(P)-dependent oxidoreductase [Nonomuraea harbinensis]|uniref:SDR family NAD(P)-dependent oxidoreductase n=1 Tax=Nonomuraea harbinensis TaxID=1286938 RepID=A0ABW1BX14_9ACTN|nr:SDR family oxidoreductase [Nonomuraea harbinensis]
MRTIVTGAASGIGRAVARRLASDAARAGEDLRIALLDIDASGVDDLARELGPGALAVQVDLGRDASLVQAVSTALDHLGGGLDGLVSNAGVISPAPLKDVRAEVWDRDFSINTRACLRLAQECYEALRGARGSIVVTASVSGTHPTADVGAYCSNKAAVSMLARQIAREWGPDGIRCNVVSPGSTFTGMTRAGLEKPGVMERRGAQVPLGRVGVPEDVAAVVAFLLGPDAAYVSGADIPVDGGWTAALMPKVSTVEA